MLISKAQIMVRGETSGRDCEAGQLLKIVYEEMPDCPRCSAPMSVRDHFWRVVIGMDGVRRKIRPRRLVCTCETCALHTRPQRNLPQGLSIEATAERTMCPLPYVQFLAKELAEEINE